MIGSRLIWLAPLSFALTFLGCGGQPSGEQPTTETTPAAPAAPVDPATAATITGKVAFDGQAPAKVRIRMDSVPACTETNKEPVFTDEVVVNENQTLQNVFVY